MPVFVKVESSFATHFPATIKHTFASAVPDKCTMALTVHNTTTHAIRLRCQATRQPVERHHTVSKATLHISANAHLDVCGMIPCAVSHLSA